MMLAGNIDGATSSNPRNWIVLFGRLALAAVLLFAVSAQSQDYPTRPIRIVVPVSPGGTIDRLARLLAEKFREKWGQPVVVESRPGAAGILGSEAVFKSAPDGYTLLLGSSAQLVTNKLLYAKLPYDPDTFVPVSVIATAPLMLTVHPKMTADSVQQLIAFAKANPNQLVFSSGGSGTSSHLAGELFKSMAGITVRHIPYKGNAPAITDLLAGHVDMMFTDLGNTLQYIRAGKFRVLAVGSEKRHPALPNAPAMSEVLPGFAAAELFGMVAPTGTPPALAEKLSIAIAETLKQSEVAQRLLDMSVEAVGSTPADMAMQMKQVGERWGAVIRMTGTKVE